MNSCRPTAILSAPLCVLAVCLSACATPGADAPLATPSAARVATPFTLVGSPQQTEPDSAGDAAFGAQASSEANAPALSAAIASTVASAGYAPAPRPVSHGIVFGALFDCKPGHAGAVPASAAAGRSAGTEAAPAAGGGHDASALAKKSQNPVSNLISLPIEYNANFDQGARRNTQTIVNVKPVVPVSISDDWNLINRLIVPLTDQPEQVPDTYSRSGLGDITYQGFFSPKKPTEGGLIWGVGPTLIMPTATDDILGSDQWAAGPSLVGLTIKDKWVLGGVVSNVWTFASNDSDRPNLRLINIQPIVNYNMGEGWYGVFSPVILGKWSAKSAGNVWTVPMGVGLGRVFKLGDTHLDLSVRPFYNVHRPDGGARWSIQILLKFLFPQE